VINLLTFSNKAFDLERQFTKSELKILRAKIILTKHLEVKLQEELS